MLLLIILVNLAAAVTAESFICESASESSYSESRETTSERLANLEKQVAVLKELTGAKKYDDVPEVLRIETLVTPKGRYRVLP